MKSNDFYICVCLVFDSERSRKMQSMCALPTKTVQWTRGGGTVASSVAFRSVWQWEWSKKVRPYQVLGTGTLLMKD